MKSHNDKSEIGFWVYIMSDCILFASLFATFAVLRSATAGGPSGAELFSLPFIFVQTLILLTSSLTAGLALLTSSTWRNVALAATLALGLTFLGLELYEFRELILEGHGPQTSAFLSAFFVLVGTHGLHVLLGSIWLIILMFNMSEIRLKCFVLFWHFLDIIWIFIFTFVYLWGMI